MSFANVGSADRIIRILFGIILLAFVAVSGVGFSSSIGIGGAIVAAILIGTSFISFCPLYAIIGLKTLKKD